jgi:hypothetical protein
LFPSTLFLFDYSRTWTGHECTGTQLYILTVFEHAKSSRKEHGCRIAHGVIAKDSPFAVPQAFLETECMHGDTKKVYILRLSFSLFFLLASNGNSGGEFFVLFLVMFLALGMWTRWIFFLQERKKSSSLSASKVWSSAVITIRA